jgi:hypothetical protein
MAIVIAARRSSVLIDGQSAIAVRLDVIDLTSLGR